ncbi:MAG: hypothetical protein M3N98_05950 [Actinomycetota bacterium]|nr:hypothetical protein [Actinomycetota bacterium]
MEDRAFDRIGAVSAVAVAGLSLLYAVSYLGISPADQRSDNADKFFGSYLAQPSGFRIASVCLLLSGLASGLAVVALAGRLSVTGGRSMQWVSATGVVVGFATAAHGLSQMLEVDKLAHRYATGDAATRSAVAVAHLAPSAADPRGLATFCLAGLVALMLGWAVRPSHLQLGSLGVVLGVDMVALFVANAVGINALVLVTGGLASVILGPLWWVGVARVLWGPRTAPAPVADPSPVSVHQS